MKKSELVKMYANLFETTQDEADKAITNVSKLIEECAAMGETFILPGILTITVETRPPRKVFNFQTKETSLSEPKNVPKVKVGKRLKDAAVGAPIG